MTKDPKQFTSDFSGAALLLISADTRDRNLLKQLLDHLGVSAHLAVLTPEGFDLHDMLERDGILIDADSDAGRAAHAAISERPDAPPILTIGSAAVSGAATFLAKPIMDASRFAAAIAELLRPRLATELAELIDMAGPDHAPALVSQIADDLVAAGGALRRAVAAQDCDGIRHQTHILISLTGAVGAARLQRQSETLNAAAHRRDVGSIGELAGPLDTGLNQLLSEIRTTGDGFVRRN